MTRKETKHDVSDPLGRSWFGVVGLVLAGALHVYAGEIGQAGDEQIREAAERAIRIESILRRQSTSMRSFAAPDLDYDRLFTSLRFDAEAAAPTPP